MSNQRCSESDESKRDIPSFIEPRPPLISNPFMRPRPQKGTNLLELFEEDSESEEAEWVQVYLRLKPCNVKSNLYEVKSDRCLITSVDTATAGHGRRTQHNVSKMYTFSHIFGPESTQKEIFENVVKVNLKRLPEGHNFTLLTYGASGSGKTYTLMGTVASPGLVPRALEYVFRVVDAAQQPIYKPSDGGEEKLGYGEQEYELQFVNRLRQVSAPLRDKYRRMSVQLRSDLTQSTFDLSSRTRYYVWVSFVEIYNEGIYDLLTHSDRSKATSKLRIREDSNGNAYVKGATQAFVRSGEEAYDIMVAGKHNLQVAATGVHAHSSRSHCIFTITMLTETDNGVRSSCVRLCDLAGCERAQKTKNTGARMQESRSINTSLHVLERCLHMLRRKQRQRVDSTLVPYRESKLTRLLGAGLSGAKLEAISMVVTVNPAPQYAHETKHVLQLATVAKDIQVNQTTIAETLTEFSSMDTTIESSAEVIRLRADNERLHFELVQSQSHNRELLASMEEKQLEMAKMMSEIADEAKDMTKQYYEAVMQSLRTEMEEMKEEYESRLAELQSADVKKPSSEVDSLSRSSQKTVAHLMRKIAILEEKLTEEKLARARAEAEIQHLRACIEERDENLLKSEQSESNEEIELSDSEEDSEDDESNNESLEPNFKKKDINQSRLLQKSLLSSNSVILNNSEVDAGDDAHMINDSVVDKSDRTIRDDGISNDETAKDSTYMTGVHEFTDNFVETFTNSCNNKDLFRGDDTQNDVSELNNDSVDRNISARGTYFDKNSDKSLDDKDVSKVSKKTQNIKPIFDECNMKNSSVQGTDFDKSTKNISGHSTKTSERGTYFVKDSKVSQNPSDNTSATVKDVSIHVEKSTRSITNSLVEKEIEQTKNENKSTKNISGNSTKTSKRGTYFVKDSKVSQNQSDNISATVKDVSIHVEKCTRSITNSVVEKEIEQTKNENNSTKNISGHNPKTSERGTYFVKDSKVSQNQSDNTSATVKDVSIHVEKSTRSITNNFVEKKIGGQTKYENRYIRSYESDVSLAQFERLEKVASISEPKANVTNPFRDIRILKEKQIFSYNKLDEPKNLINVNIDKNSTYFDYIDVNLDKNVADVKNLHPCDDRSPSIVKDEVTNDFEPNKIKILLGESFSRQPDMLSSVHKIMLPKKQASVDMFEGLDSPIVKPSENIYSNLTDIVEKKDGSQIINQEDNETLQSESDLKAEMVEKAKTLKVVLDPKEFDTYKLQQVNEIIANKTLDQAEKFDVPPIIAQATNELIIVESTRESLQNMVLEENIEVNKTDNKPASKNISSTEEPSIEMSLISVKNESQSDQIKSNNTTEDFERIYKDITAPRATEFELLFPQELNSTGINDVNKTESTNEAAKLKYNLRHKENTSKKEKVKNDELYQREVQTELKPPKRNLRLRRRKNQDDDEKAQNDPTKLKDISNLQKEFSDVTLDVPAAKKDVEDMQSPEKCSEEDENVPPMNCAQSCPSKSITRSRRKLFTPRADVLEESLGAPGDSNERVCVPRPSYHRPRARRRL